MNIRLFQIEEGIVCAIVEATDATATTTAATATTEATDAVAEVPVHTIAVVDVSGSMSISGKLRSVQHTLEQLIDVMKDRDELSLISFQSEAKVELSRVTATADHREIIRERVRGLIADGSTNMCAALAYINDVVYPSTHLKQGVVFLTDGHTNTGSNEDLLLRLKGLVHTYPSLTFSAVGYGQDHNAGLLSSMATEGSGSYNMVNGMDEVANVFGDIFGGLKTCAYEQLRLSVPSHVRQRSSYALHARPDGSHDVFVGDLHSGSPVCVVLEGFVLGTDRLDVRATCVSTGLPALFENVAVTTEVTPELRVQGHHAFLRTRVVAFMKDVNQYITGAPDAAKYAALKEQAKVLAAEVEAARTEGTDHPLLDLLAREIRRSETYMNLTFTTPPSLNLTHQRSTMLSQHTACVGLGRGVLSSRHEDDLEDEPNAAVFSNPYQRSTSEDLRHTTATTPMAQVHPLTPYPSLSPMTPPATPRNTSMYLPPPPVLRKTRSSNPS